MKTDIEMTVSSSQRNILLAAFFVGVSLFLWFAPNIFFWNDDWFFIYNYFNTGHLSYIFTHYNGHFKPLFKLLYFSEIFAFGKNAVFYHLVSLVFFGLTAYLFALILREVSSRNGALAVILAALLIGHPNCGQITLWIFETCIIMQLFFQALTILFFFRYARTDSSRYFWLFMASLITQNYFFGNGIFFPMLFVFALMVERGFRINSRIILLLVLQVAFVLIQYLATLHQASTVYKAPSLHILHDYRLVLHAFYNLVAAGITRLFFIKQIGGKALAAVSVLVFAAICALAWRTDRSKTLFGLAYLFISAISIPIARTSLLVHNEINYYYTVLLLPALFFLIYVAFSGLTGGLYRAVIVLAMLAFCGYFIMDIQVRKIYTYIHFKNKERLMDAITYGKSNYYPFEEPEIVMYKNTYLFDNGDHPVLQRSLQKTGYFEMDTVIHNSPGIFGPTYEARTKKTMDTYRQLTKKTFIDFDINFERR